MLEKLVLGLTRQFSMRNVFCEACEFVKHTRHVYPATNNKSSKPLMIVHSDILGPSRSKSLTGCRWFIKFINALVKPLVYIL